MKKTTAVLMLGLGLMLPACGGLGDVQGRAAAAVKTAGVLEKDVHAANEKLKELTQVLQTAGESMSKKQYPTSLATALPALTIPFDATNLDHRELTDFPRKTVQALLQYTMEVQALNTSLEKLKNLLTAAQPAIERTWKDEKEPVVTYSVIFRPEGSKGMVAELVPVKDPFKLDGDFPREYTVIKVDMDRASPRPVEKRATRWERGALTGSEPIAIPVVPQSMAFIADRAVSQLRLKLIEPLETLNGKDKGLPMEVPGLIAKGEDLENDLKKIALAK